MTAHTISLDATAITRILTALAVLMLLASIGGQVAMYEFGHNNLKGLVPLFNVGNERNIPTWFSTLLMLIASLLLAVIAVLNAKQRAPFVSKWVVLTLGFVFMAYDEAFQVHEKLVRPLRELLGGKDLGIFYFAWVVPGIALVLVLSVFFLKFLLYLPAATGRLFLVAAVLYLGGAIGAELVGGYHADLHGRENFVYGMITTVEEGLEMAGLIVFIRALLDYCAERYGEIAFRLCGARPDT